MLVMTSGRKAVLRTGFETDRGTLRRVLSQLRPATRRVGHAKPWRWRCRCFEAGSMAASTS